MLVVTEALRVSAATAVADLTDVQDLNIMRNGLSGMLARSTLYPSN